MVGLKELDLFRPWKGGFRSMGLEEELRSEPWSWLLALLELSLLSPAPAQPGCLWSFSSPERWRKQQQGGELWEKWKRRE